MRLPHISFRDRCRPRTSQPEDWMHRFPVEGPVAHVYADMLNVSRWTRCLNAPSFYHPSQSEATIWLKMFCVITPAIFLIFLETSPIS